MEKSGHPGRLSAVPRIVATNEVERNGPNVVKRTRLCTTCCRSMPRAAAPRRLQLTFSLSLRYGPALLR